MLLSFDENRKARPYWGGMWWTRFELLWPCPWGVSRLACNPPSDVRCVSRHMLHVQVVMALINFLPGTLKLPFLTSLVQRRITKNLLISFNNNVLLNNLRKLRYNKKAYEPSACRWVGGCHYLLMKIMFWIFLFSTETTKVTSIGAPEA